MILADALPAHLQESAALQEPVTSPGEARGGLLAEESVAGCPWNGWPNVHGIGGRITVESVAECGRNTQSFSRKTAPSSR
jgi:hypothetical protein